MAKKYFEEINRYSLKWKNFIDKKNTKDVIVYKAHSLADAIISLVLSGMEGLQKAISTQSNIDINDAQWWAIHYDFLLFFIHLSDRESFEYLNKTQKTLFIESLFGKVLKICSKYFESDRAEQFKQNFTQNFVLFQKKFSSYQRGKSKNITQNINYMFTERILKRMGLNSSTILHTQITPFIIKIELLLNIPELLNDSKT